LIEIYRKNGDDNWYLITETDLKVDIELTSINLKMPLKEIYDRVF
jgi:Uma2 family endonuclease